MYEHWQFASFYTCTPWKSMDDYPEEVHRHEAGGLERQDCGPRVYPV